MESSTRNEQALEQALQAIQHAPGLGPDWEQVPAQLGIDLEQSARETKAIQRVREIRNAADLLHLILFFAISDWSLRLCGAWALVCGIGYLSDVAILKRLRNSRVWLGYLVGQLLAKRCAGLRSLPGVRLRLVDATTISAPGSQSTDWRIHLSFDLGHFLVDGLEVTDRHGGERLTRFPAAGNEILIADAGYAFASGMGPVLWQDARLIVRIHWRNVAVFTPDGQRFAMIAWLHTLQGPTETAVQLETPQGWVNLRLLAAALPPEKAEAARRRVRKRYHRKQHSLSQETLFAAGFVLLLTNLPTEAWDTALVFFLYRVRWQIELLIKRLKGVLELEGLRAKDPALAQTYLLAKLLLSLLIEQSIHPLALQQPDWFVSLAHPFNPTRLMRWGYEALRQIIFGPWLVKHVVQWLVIMRRYFCDPPRSRPQQLAWARAVFDHLVSSAPNPLS